KVTGRARYTHDISRPGMLYGKIVRSPIPHARITSIDLSAAQKAPGVKAVLAWKEAGAELFYQGDPVAAVAAEARSMAANAPSWSSAQANTRAGTKQETGDLEAGFKNAAHVVEQTYSTLGIVHV